MDAQKAVRRGQVVVAGFERHNWASHLHFAQKADGALCGADADADAALVIVTFAFPFPLPETCVCAFVLAYTCMYVSVY